MIARATIVKLLALGAIVASVMPLGAKLWWGFELATHFRVQYVVIDVALLVVLAWRRCWLFSGVLAACAGLSAWSVAPYWPQGIATPTVSAQSASTERSAPQSESAGRSPQDSENAATPAASAATVKIATANVLYTRSPTRRLFEIVRAESPDVLVLVEYTPRWAEAAEAIRTDYPHHFELPATGATGIALFSRLPFESVEQVALGAMPAIEAVVHTPSGPLTVLGIHLSSPKSPRYAAARDRQLALLAERVARIATPVAIIGDLNITPYSPPFEEFLNRTGFMDTRRGRTLSPSWPAFLPLLGIPIDHCIVSRDLSVVAHRGLPRFGSDHYPILAELALPTR